MRGETLRRLAAVPHLQIHENVPLGEHTRFGIGGAADALIDSWSEPAFLEALAIVRAARGNHVVIGAGTNLIVADEGFRGVVLRYRGNALERDGNVVTAGAGAILQDLVDFSIAQGLAGLHTMTGIPGWVGGAVYGNAGAYGRSVHQSVTRVRFSDGSKIRQFDNAECGFRYRESNFKRNKDWVILNAEFAFEPGDGEQLQTTAAGIRRIRDEKYPPSMKCAGSIFKNLLLEELAPEVRARVPAEAIREGKVPSAWFLEQVGAKGMVNGGIEVASYHANLIYNAGGGTARETCQIIAELKNRVRNEFGFEVEEEVQYVGFPDGRCA